MIMAKARRDSFGTDNIKFSVIFPIQIITPILSKAYKKVYIEIWIQTNKKQSNLHSNKQSCKK